MPVEAPRKKALASSVERSESLTNSIAGWHEFKMKCICLFTGGSASDVIDRYFSASLDACRYHALPGLSQAAGLAGGYDFW